MKYLLGVDVGSSSVKVACVNAANNEVIGECSSPATELAIYSPQDGFAEQSPHLWYEHFLLAYRQLLKSKQINPAHIVAIGIAYQMHGLVVLNKNGDLVHDAIIWCDSRAVNIGNRAYQDNIIYAQSNLLNSPANLTLAKLAWLKLNKPEIYQKIHKFMLPGDYLAYKLTGVMTTTACGLSEMIAWDFHSHGIATNMFDYFGFSYDLLPQVIDNFSDQLIIDQKIAKELNLNTKVVVSYRAGDQPNNAFGLKVLESGSVAANAGTSGVLYGITDEPIAFDERINQVLHVNRKIGLLLCLNGAGSANSWLKNKLLGQQNGSYNAMNQQASTIDCGSDGLIVIPFGNGAERIFANKNPYAHIMHLDFNIHTQAHIMRAFIEGVAFALCQGVNIMRQLKIKVDVLCAGFTNMFLSEIFCNTVATIAEVNIELYNSNGAVAAALAAAIGANIYEDFASALVSIGCVKKISKEVYGKHKHQLMTNYLRYEDYLKSILKQE